ncbi:unnamed protein product [Urochloa humidicola]
MVRTTDHPYAAGGLDPLGHLSSPSMPPDHPLIGTPGPGGYPTSLSAHPTGRAAGSSHRHRPPPLSRVLAQSTREQRRI